MISKTTLLLLPAAVVLAAIILPTGAHAFAHGWLGECTTGTAPVMCAIARVLLSIAAGIVSIVCAFEACEAHEKENESVLEILGNIRRTDFVSGNTYLVQCTPDEPTYNALVAWVKANTHGLLTVAPVRYGYFFYATTAKDAVDVPPRLYR